MAKEKYRKRNQGKRKKYSKYVMNDEAVMSSEVASYDFHQDGVFIPM